MTALRLLIVLPLCFAFAILRVLTACFYFVLLFFASFHPKQEKSLVDLYHALTVWRPYTFRNNETSHVPV
jgi:hypothetical protein